MPTNDTPPTDPLAQFLESARQLNEASNQVNIELQRLEKALGDANVGLPFWFDEKPLQQSDATGDVGPNATSEYTSDVLGYSRVDGKWQLAVKRLREVSGYYEGHMDSPWANVFAEGEPIALLKATRELRILALRMMPEFLTAFRNRIADHVVHIEATTGKIFW